MVSSFEKKFVLHLPSSTENLALIRDFVSKIGAQAGLEQGQVSMIELAVDEACANVIEHAYGSDQTKEVIVRARLNEDTIEIQVEDTGKGFDPGTIEQKELTKLIAERRSGGLGMRMMQMVMDEVQYSIKPGERNELRMIKRLKRS
ncbi:MAG: ATP-binding protein [Bryobacteraceae bacterium]|nr:ATP-binding protein [Bryobacteraceae bacterium]